MLIFGLGRLVFNELQEMNDDINIFIRDPLFVHAESGFHFFDLTAYSPAVNKLACKPIEQLSQWKPWCYYKSMFLTNTISFYKSFS